MGNRIPLQAWGTLIKKILTGKKKLQKTKYKKNFICKFNFIVNFPIFTPNFLHAPKTRGEGDFIKFFISKFKKKYMLREIPDATCLSTTKQLSLVSCNSSLIDCENQMTRAIILGNFFLDIFWTYLSTRLHKIFLFLCFGLF